MKFFEKKQYDYIYVDEKNQVHVLVPMVGGTSIGTDNTCKTFNELNKFFSSRGILVSLNQYISDLRKDINILEKLNQKDPQISELTQFKKVRLKQLEHYLEKLQFISHQSFFTTTTYPDSIKMALSTPEQNCVCVSLAPSNPDIYTLDKKYSIFSLERSDFFRGLETDIRFNMPLDTLLKSGEKSFTNKLIEKSCEIYKLKKEIEEKKEKNIIIKNDSEFSLLKGCIAEAFISINPNHLSTPLALEREKKEIQESIDNYDPKYNPGIILNLNIILGTLCFQPEEAKLEEITTATINTCFKRNNLNIFDQELNPFAITITDPKAERERLSICCQFLLANINAYCFSRGNANNFGKILCSQEFLKKNLCKKIAEAKTPEILEDNIFEFINENYKIFAMGKPLDNNEISIIKKRFKEQYFIIKNSDHFDQFLMFLPDAPRGDFYIHQARICLHFSKFASEHKIYHPLYTYYKSIEQQQPPILASQIHESKERTTERHVLPNLNDIPIEYPIIESLQELNIEKIVPLLVSIARDTDEQKPTGGMKNFAILDKNEINKLQNHVQWKTIYQKTLNQLNENERKAFDKIFSDSKKELPPFTPEAKEIKIHSYLEKKDISKVSFEMKSQSYIFGSMTRIPQIEKELGINIKFNEAKKWRPYSIENKLNQFRVEHFLTKCMRCDNKHYKIKKAILDVIAAKIIELEWIRHSQSEKIKTTGEEKYLFFIDLYRRLSTLDLDNKKECVDLQQSIDSILQDKNHFIHTFRTTCGRLFFRKTDSCELLDKINTFIENNRTQPSLPVVPMLGRQHHQSRHS